MLQLLDLPLPITEKSSQTTVKYLTNHTQRRIQKIDKPCEKSEIFRFSKIFPDFGRYLKFLHWEFTIFTWSKSAPDTKDSKESIKRIRSRFLPTICLLIPLLIVRTYKFIRRIREFSLSSINLTTFLDPPLSTTGNSSQMIMKHLIKYQKFQWINSFEWDRLSSHSSTMLDTEPIS